MLHFIDEVIDRRLMCFEVVYLTGAVIYESNHCEFDKVVSGRGFISGSMSFGRMGSKEHAAD